MYEKGYHNLVVTGYLGEIYVSRNWRLKNSDIPDFYPSKKKGIIPVDMTESQKALCGSELKFALSDFKKRF
ncbi:hypothetical protein K5Z09_004561 [Escherichia coli]|nr:hypothetical protein [Escherichia coli]EHR8987301.1 hypothetical protein [Escherichia coli]EHR9096815.1 hypothetical protein [Escherichia coli]EHR9219368.1 hypothetical protein [Escherichia coli]EIM2921061.1 hypothetical protein [Escherichia coli]